MGNPVDKRGVLEEEIFTYKISKDNKVFLFWQGKPAVTLSGGKAQRFIRDISNAEGKAAQLIMAKATGNFKRGNERKKDV